MEIKIVITKENKDEVLKLIDQLVESENRVISDKPVNNFDNNLIHKKSEGLITEQLPDIEEKDFGEPIIEEHIFGTWGLFNSYVPGKTGLRVLINLMRQNDTGTINFSELIDKCQETFIKLNLGKYRGFPKKTSESAQNRFENHLLLPFNSMGLIRLLGEGKEKTVLITKSGYEFAQLDNGLLDKGDKKKYLTEEESNWLINYLKEINEKGFREFSILKNLTDFISTKKRNFAELTEWLKKKDEFKNWLRKGSRYEHDPKAFEKQLENVSRTMITGKIGLLRELGVLGDKRGEYKLLKNF